MWEELVEVDARVLATKTENVFAFDPADGIDELEIVLILRLIGERGRAKLETGTEDYYQLVERTKVPFRRVLDNIAAAAKVRPVVIQSLFMRIRGDAPTAAEVDAFCDRLAEIVAGGGALKLVQVYTVARPPAESFVSSLAESELEAIAARIRARGIAAEVFGGS